MKASALLPLLLPSASCAFAPSPSRLAHPTRSRPAAAAAATSLYAAAPLGDGGEKSPNFFRNIFGGMGKAVGDLTRDETVIETDFKLAWTFAMASVIIWFIYPDKSMCTPGITEHFCQPTFIGGLCSFVHMWFALFLADRSSRIRVVFNDRDRKFQIKNLYKEGSFRYEDRLDVLEERKRNYVVGTTDGWEYDKFLNYAFVPSVDLPILVYFKEDKTPPRKWTVGPGKYDPVGGGMVHFFPAFCNSYQLKREFERRGLNKRKLTKE